MNLRNFHILKINPKLQDPQMNFEMCFKVEGSVSIIAGNVYETDPRWIQVDPNPYPYRIRGSAYPAPGPDGSGNIAPKVLVDQNL
jgi:hypothetical protein